MSNTVGYTDGIAEKPCYRNINDHSEAIRVEYDPYKVNYSGLMDVFWES